MLHVRPSPWHPKSETWHLTPGTCHLTPETRTQSFFPIYHLAPVTWLLLFPHLPQESTVEVWLRLFPTYHIPPTTYHVRPTTYRHLTTFVFNNIPAFNAYLLCYQRHSRFALDSPNAILCFQ